MEENIVLIGMMGTSKSASGKVLADMLDKMFLDVDELIAYEEMPIKEIFEKFGQDEFRRIEERTIKRVSTFENIVISTGGGVVLNEKNMINLKNNAIIVWLVAKPKVILQRVLLDGDKRPLLQNPTKAKIVSIFKDRKKKYKQFSDFCVDTSKKTPEQIAEEIVTKINKLKK